MRERRRFPRYNCSYNADYYTYGLVSLEGRTVGEDISEGGMRLSISKIIRKGDVLRMGVHASSKECPIYVRCKVKWVQKTKDELKFNVYAGVEFVSAEPEDVNKLLHLV